MLDNDSTANKEKTRHLFLFPGEIIVTKPTKTTTGETYEYKSQCPVSIYLL